uniref:peptidoglycan-binding protein n=1 Tax=Candidatus Entotheonella palauensis TaxID=93172 RepID=UPI001C4DF3BB
APDTEDMDNGSLSRVAWSDDGQWLYAGGEFNDSSGINLIVRWANAGHGLRTILPASANTITTLRALSQGGLVFSAADPMFGVFDRDRNKVLAQPPKTVDFRSRRTGNLRVSHHGSIVAFDFRTLSSDTRWAYHAARIHIDKGALHVDPPGMAGDIEQLQQALAKRGYDPGPIDGIAGPRTAAAIKAFQRGQGINADGQLSPTLKRQLGLAQLQPARTEGLPIRDWDGSYEPKLNDARLPLERNEFALSLAIAPDDHCFLLGTNRWLRRFDRGGKPRWQVTAPGAVWAVNTSGDGRLAIAAFGDGTLRWYRMSDGAEQLALFVHPDRNRWVLWTPEGFFNAAPGAENLIGYHLNQGPKSAGRFVNADQLHRHFYRPDLVARRLEDGIEPVLQEALTDIGDVHKVLTGGLPPELEQL